MFHRRGGSRVRSPTAAFCNHGMNPADDPLQLGGATLRTSNLDMVFPALHEQLGQCLTALANKFVYGHTGSSL